MERGPFLTTGPAHDAPLPVLQSKSETRSFYNKISKVYDLMAEHTEQPVRDAGLSLLRLRPGQTVLEIGPGTGHSLATIAAQLGPDGRAIGLDLSEGMLHHAKAAAPAAVLLQADAAAIPLAEASVDAIFLCFTLELFDTPEIPAVLAECRRALRPTGAIVVCSLSKQESTAAVKAYEWGHRHFPNFLNCRPIYTRAALQHAGFTIQETQMMHVWLPVEVVSACLPPE